MPVFPFRKYRHFYWHSVRFTSNYLARLNCLASLSVFTCSFGSSSNSIFSLPTVVETVPYRFSLNSLAIDCRVTAESSWHKYIATHRGTFFDPGPRAALYILASVTLNRFATADTIFLQDGRHLALAPRDRPRTEVAERFLCAALRNFLSPMMDGRFFLP